MNNFAPIFLLAFPVLFVGSCCLVLWLPSRLSGWSRLAAEFHSPEPFTGTLFRFQSIRMGSVNYDGIVHLGVSREGLYLVPFFMLRLFQKPLLIPWQEIETTPTKRLLFEMTRLTFASCPRAKVEMSRKTFAKLVEELQSQAEGTGEEIENFE